MKISKLNYMGYSNGQLETSSGTGKGEKGEPGLPGIGFNLDDDGKFDLDSKRLTMWLILLILRMLRRKKMLMIISPVVLLAKNMLTMKTLNKILPLTVKQKKMKYFFSMEVKS